MKNNDVLNEFKESTWGKKVDGEYVIDGYKFRGRQPFKRAKEGLENLMVRGHQGEVEGIKYKVLDSRNKGVELEIDIEVCENGKKGVDNRGIAVMKLYGPNKKKENSVLVTKRSSPTSWILSPNSTVRSDQPSKSCSSIPSSIDTIGYRLTRSAR